MGERGKPRAFIGFIGRKEHFIDDVSFSESGPPLEPWSKAFFSVSSCHTLCWELDGEEGRRSRAPLMEINGLLRKSGKPQCPTSSKILIQFFSSLSLIGLIDQCALGPRDLMASTSMAKLGRELIAYTLSPPAEASASSSAPPYASIVTLSHPTPSAPVASLRGVTPFPSSLSLISSPLRPSCLTVHSDAKKAQIYVHEPRVSGPSTTTTTTLSHHLHPPEPTPCIAVSPTGAYLAAGSTSGKLYLWELASGSLVCALDAHFRQVTCLSFTPDGLGLVSASADARLLVYSLAALVSSASSEAGKAPYAVFADHTQSITALSYSSYSAAAAAESFPSSTRILSASEDGCVKLWDVRSRRLVRTWTFSGSGGRPVTHLAVESGARAFFVVLGDAGQDDVMEEDEEEEEGGEDAAGARGDAVKRVDMYAPSGQAGGESTDQTVVKGAALYRTA